MSIEIFGTMLVSSALKKVPKNTEALTTYKCQPSRYIEVGLVGAILDGRSCGSETCGMEKRKWQRC